MLAIVVLAAHDGGVRRRLAVLVSTAVLAAGCSNSSPTDAAPTTTSTTPAVDAPSTTIQSSTTTAAIHDAGELDRGLVVSIDGFALGTGDVVGLRVHPTPNPIELQVSGIDGRLELCWDFNYDSCTDLREGVTTMPATLGLSHNLVEIRSPDNGALEALWVGYEPEDGFFSVAVTGSHRTLTLTGPGASEIVILNERSDSSVVVNGTIVTAREWVSIDTTGNDSRAVTLTHVEGDSQVTIDWLDVIDVDLARESSG